MGIPYPIASTEIWLGGTNEPDPETGSDQIHVGNSVIMGKVSTSRFVKCANSAQNQEL